MNASVSCHPAPCHLALRSKVCTAALDLPVTCKSYSVKGACCERQARADKAAHCSSVRSGAITKHEAVHVQLMITANECMCSAQSASAHQSAWALLHAWIPSDHQFPQSLGCAPEWESRGVCLKVQAVQRKTWQLCDGLCGSHCVHRPD